MPIIVYKYIHVTAASISKEDVDSLHYAGGGQIRSMLTPLSIYLTGFWFINGKKILSRYSNSRKIKIHASE